MNCGMECIKYLLFIFNFVCALGGLTILVLGVLAITNPESAVIKEAHADDLNFELIMYALIVIGAVIFIITFFGCCGAIRESHCMIVTYGVLLLTLLVIQVAIATYVFIKFTGDDAEPKVTEAGKKMFESSIDPRTDPSIKRVWKNLEQFGNCCGFNGYDDYIGRSLKIPGSCCKHQMFNNSCSVSEVNNAGFTQGCKTKIYEFFKTTSGILGVVALCIAGVELIGIIFSFCLANSILNVERRGYKV